jgi:hypothetical protein
MKVLRRRVLAAALSLTAAVGGLLVAGTAQAQPATTASLSFSGDSGDYISQGQSWSYSTSNGDALDVSGSTSGFHIAVNAYNGDWWTLDIDAPDQAIAGQPAALAPGTYADAHRYPFNGTGPGLDLSGEGRGCNELTGSFTITNAVFGPEGYVETFDATFEQHCEGGSPAARGEVHVSNAPAPPGSDPQPPPASDPAPPPASDPAPPPTSDAAPPPASDPPAGAAHQAMARRAATATQPSITGTSSPTRERASSQDTARALLIGGIVAAAIFVAVVLGAVGVFIAVRRR